MERKITVAGENITVACILTEPDGGDVRRLVLGVHGFGGSMTDSIQVSIAEEMALFHAAVLRFDFPAHGESPADSELTLRGCMDSVMAAAGELRRRYSDVEDLCIFATGFGAYVTMLCLDELTMLPGRVKLVVQTPSVRMDETVLGMIRMSAQTLRAVDRCTLNAPRPFDVTYRFYKELRENSVFDHDTVPMLILQGEADDFIPMEDIRGLRQLNEDSKLVIIPGASHRFLEDGAWDMVLDLTRDWFAFEQVLLADWS